MQHVTSHVTYMPINWMDESDLRTLSKGIKQIKLGNFGQEVQTRALGKPDKKNRLKQLHIFNSDVGYFSVIRSQGDKGRKIAKF